MRTLPLSLRCLPGPPARSIPLPAMQGAAVIPQEIVCARAIRGLEDSRRRCEEMFRRALARGDRHDVLAFEAMFADIDRAIDALNRLVLA